MSNKIQVKDTSSYGILFFLITMFPFIFLFLSFNCGYILGAIITFLVYSLIVLAFIKYNKTDKYVIEANEDEITISKYGTYKWEQISDIKSVRELNMLTLQRRVYLRFYLTKGKIILLDSSNFDIYGEELAQKLKQLGKL